MIISAISESSGDMSVQVSMVEGKTHIIEFYTIYRNFDREDGRRTILGMSNTKHPKSDSQMLSHNHGMRENGAQK